MTTGPPRARFSQNRLLQGLLAFYLILWIVLAISPVDRRDWLLENLLAFVGIAILIATYRRFPFSDFSYVLITIFMALHAIGAHYTYAEVPLGFWIQDIFDLERNHFDRGVHFAFGFLLAYPIRELYVRTGHDRGAWSYIIPVAILLAFSGFFEMVEAWVAQIVSPELGAAYLGTQGDEWDAQNDMTAALTGAILAMTATGFWFSRLPSRSRLL